MKQDFGKQYFSELEIVKGIAILFVIAMHCMCVSPVPIAPNTPDFLKSFVGIFQMPLFFVASGFLFSTTDTWDTFLIKKTKRLLVPWLVFSLLSFMMHSLRLLSEGNLDVCKDRLLSIITGQTYWFLFSLFFIMIIAKVITNNLLRIGLCFLSIIAVLNSDIAEVEIFSIGRTSVFGVWFFIGIGFRKYYFTLSTRYSMIISVLSFICYLFFCTSIMLSSSFLSKYIAPLFGCIMAWSLSVVLSRLKNNLLRNILAHFGKFSLQYYLNHLLIMQFCNLIAYKMPINSLIVKYFVIFTLAIVGSRILLMIENKYKNTRCLSGL